MFIVSVKEDHYPAATFSDHAEGQKFFDSIPPDVQKDYEVVTPLYEYPYYWLWTWDIHDALGNGPDGPSLPRNTKKDKRKIVGAEEVDAFVKSLPRDHEWERKFDTLNAAYDEDQDKYEALAKEYGFSLETVDEQYFYLGILHQDGISYGLRQKLGMSTDGMGFECHDHEHVDGVLLARLKAMGVERALIRWKDEIAYKKRRRHRRIINRLYSIDKRVGLSVAGQRKLARLSKLPSL